MMINIKENRITFFLTKLIKRGHVILNIFCTDLSFIIYHLSFKQFCCNGATKFQIYIIQRARYSKYIHTLSY